MTGDLWCLMHEAVDMHNCIDRERGIDIESTEEFKELLIRNGAHNVSIDEDGSVTLPRTITIGDVTIRYGMPDAHAIRETYKIGED